MTIAASRPSLRMIRVCQTMVVRPRWSGVHSARMVSPAGTAAKKLVLLSIVVVPAPARHVHEGGGAAHVVGNAHHRAAMQAAIAVGELLAHHDFRHHPVARDLDDLEPHQLGEGRLLGGDRLDAAIGVGGRRSFMRSVR